MMASKKELVARGQVGGAGMGRSFGGSSFGVDLWGGSLGWIFGGGVA